MPKDGINFEETGFLPSCCLKVAIVDLMWVLITFSAFFLLCSFAKMLKFGAISPSVATGNFFLPAGS